MSMKKDMYEHHQNCLQCKLLISLCILQTMQSKRDHRIMVNFNKEIKYHGNDFKNGYKKKVIEGFGQNLKMIIKVYAKIYYKV